MRRLTNKITFLTMIIFSLISYATTDNCVITTSGINFGNYLGLTLDVNGTLNISCNYSGSPEKVYISLGPTQLNPRQMNSGSALLYYNIYTDVNRTMIWGNGLQGSNIVGPLPCNMSSSSTCVVPFQTLYGRIPALQVTLFLSNFLQAVPYSISTDSAGNRVVGSGMFNVTAKNTDTCRISANDANLGVYNYQSSLFGSGTVSITCNNIGNYQVTLQPSNAGASSTGSGILVSGNNKLKYQLYRASSNSPYAACAFTTPWGHTNPNSLAVTTANAPLAYNICINIPAGQNVPPGSYTDTVIATITF